MGLESVGVASRDAGRQIPSQNRQEGDRGIFVSVRTSGPDSRTYSFRENGAAMCYTESTAC